MHKKTEITQQMKDDERLYNLITGPTCTILFRNLRLMLLITMIMVIMKHYNFLIHSWFWAFSWLWIDPCLGELRLIFHDHLRRREKIQLENKKNRGVI